MTVKVAVAVVVSSALTALIVAAVFAALWFYSGSPEESAAESGSEEVQSGESEPEEPQPETPSGAGAESEETLLARLPECEPEDEDCIRELVALYHPDATYSGGGYSAMAGRTQYYFEGSENVEACEFLDVSTQTGGGAAYGEPGYYEVRIEGVEDGCVIPTPQFE